MVLYVHYTVSYRDLEEIMAERGVNGDPATLDRWVAKYSPLIASNAPRRKAPLTPGLCPFAPFAALAT